MARRFMPACALMLAMIAAPAQAREYYYFHRANVTHERYAADRIACDRLAGGVRAPQRSTNMLVPQYSTLSPTTNAASVAIASLFAGLLLRDSGKDTIRLVERTCMADKGYARYRVEKPVVVAIDKLPTDEAKIERYFALATASVPTGERISE